MLYISTVSQEYSIHVGSFDHGIPVENVVSVQADGHELDQIVAWGFPNTGARVQRYYGDQAKFIVGNWK